MSIEGLTIVKERVMTRAEKLSEQWGDFDQDVVVFELSDGSLIYPSSDEEGNAPGALFQLSADKKHNYIRKIEDAHIPIN